MYTADLLQNDDHIRPQALRNEVPLDLEGSDIHIREPLNLCSRRGLRRRIHCLASPTPQDIREPPALRSPRELDWLLGT